MAHVEYETMDDSGLERIRPLWELLRLYHKERSRYFSATYDSFTFENRMAALRKKSTGGIMSVDIASDNGHDVGYCIRSVTADLEGEVDSIFVEHRYRSAGIGETLMGRALEWMNSKGAVKKKISIATGNEGVLPFYEKFGFLPRYVILEQICP